MYSTTFNKIRNAYGSMIVESRVANRGNGINEDVSNIVSSIAKEVYENTDYAITEDDNKAFKEVQDNISATMKKPEDVKKFVEQNDAVVKKENNSILTKGWNMVKKALGAGQNGLKWLGDHWKDVLTVFSVVGLAALGFKFYKTLGVLETAVRNFGTGPEIGAAAANAAMDRIGDVNAIAQQAATTAANATMDRIGDVNAIAQDAAKTAANTAMDRVGDVPEIANKAATTAANTAVDQLTKKVDIEKVAKDAAKDAANTAMNRTTNAAKNAARKIFPFGKK